MHLEIYDERRSTHLFQAVLRALSHAVSDCVLKLAFRGSPMPGYRDTAAGRLEHSRAPQTVERRDCGYPTGGSCVNRFGGVERSPGLAG